MQLALGAWMLIAPRSFFREVGAFGTANPHYVRDIGTFTVALGVALAIAYARRGWRPGVVGFAFLQYLFHTVNHLADIGDAHPERLGPINFGLLAAATALLGWLLTRVLREGGGDAPR